MGLGCSPACDKMKQIKSSFYCKEVAGAQYTVSWLQTTAYEGLLHWSHPKGFFSVWVCVPRKVMLRLGFLFPWGSWCFRTSGGESRTAVCSLRAVVPWGSLLFLRDW